MEERVNHFNITGDQREIIIREGDAREIKVPRKVEINGTIVAPYEYLKKRHEIMPLIESHLLIDRTKGELRLVINESGVTKGKIKALVESKDSALETIDEVHKTANTMAPGQEHEAAVTGGMKRNPKLQSLGLYEIGAAKVMSLEEMKRLVTNLKYLFKDRDNTKLLKSLQDFKLKREVELRNKNDKRGGIDNGYSSKVTNAEDMVFEFTLYTPVYIGCQPSFIRCEICLNAIENQVQLWLESPELIEQSETMKDDIIDDQIKMIKNDFPELAIYEV